MRYVIIFCLLATTACSGKQKRCYEKTESSFATFLDDDWRTYCDEFYQYTEDSEAFDLLDVTVFLTDHSYNSEQLRSRLRRYENVDSCFSSGSEQLEYRRLNSCIQDDSTTQLKLIDSWKAAIEPFMEDLQLTINSTTPKLAAAEKTGQSLKDKAANALRYSKKTDKSRLDEFQELLSTTADEVGRLDEAVAKYDEIVEASKDNEDLTAELQSEVQDDIKEMREDIADQIETVEALSELSGYLQIVEDTAGKSCPDKGISQVSETRIAIKALRSYFEKIESGRIRIDSRTKKTKEDGVRVETFGGYACGLRKDEDQFPGASLCTVHRFEMQRKKDGRRWGAWKVLKKEEGDLSDGIDCRRVD